MLPPRQAQALELQKSGLSIRQIAREMGCKVVTVKTHLARARENREKFSSVEMPEGFAMPKTTVHYKRGEDGEYVVSNEWRRLVPDAAIAEKFANELCEKVRGKASVAKYRPRKTDRSDTLLEIAISDAHLGAYAWSDETGDENYSLDIGAERILESIAEIAGSCRAHSVQLVFNGDLLHSDNRSGTTEKSGHILDMDGRFSKIVRTLRATLTSAVDMLAEVAPQITIRVLRGNHDPMTGDWLTLVLDSYYRSCPSVTVDMAATNRRAMSWGKIMLAWAHGDKVSPVEQAQTFAAQFPEIWGKTRRRYCHLAHRHHKFKLPPVLVKEKQGIVVEFLSPLCSTDSFASEYGYIKNLRGAEGFLYSKERMLTRWPVEW